MSNRFFQLLISYQPSNTHYRSFFKDIVSVTGAIKSIQTSSSGGGDNCAQESMVMNRGLCWSKILANTNAVGVHSKHSPKSTCRMSGHVISNFRAMTQIL